MPVLLTDVRSAIKSTSKLLPLLASDGSSKTDGPVDPATDP